MLSCGNYELGGNGAICRNVFLTGVVFIIFSGSGHWLVGLHSKVGTNFLKPYNFTSISKEIFILKKKILADHAYKDVFIKWVEENVIGVDVEISSALPTAKGFVHLKWRWVTERTFETFNFFRRLAKDYEKTTESLESWIILQNCQIILNRLENIWNLIFKHALKGICIQQIFPRDLWREFHIKKGYRLKKNSLSIN